MVFGRTLGVTHTFSYRHNRGVMSAAMQKKSTRVLYRMGAAIRTKAQKGFRQRSSGAGRKNYPYGLPSRAGGKPKVPPYTTGPKNLGPVGNLIKFDVNEKKLELVVGPEKMRSDPRLHIKPTGGKTIPNVLEFGGAQKLVKPTSPFMPPTKAQQAQGEKPKRRTIRYAKRPFMNRAYKQVSNFKNYKRFFESLG